MNFLKSIFKFVIIFILTLSFSNISSSEEKNYYKDLITDWSRIFPDSNRNAINYDDFIEYNKLYCAVSGSLIDPNSEPDFLFVNERETKKKICGDYYKCCIPCSCDIMKYSEIEKMKYKFQDGLKEFFVFTIKNPCGKKDFPDRVNKNYFCNGDKINSKQVYELNDRIVIGLLHNGKICAKDEIDFVKSHQVTGRFCELRNNTPIESLNAGMGDIFIKLAR